MTPLLLANAPRYLARGGLEPLSNIACQAHQKKHQQLLADAFYIYRKKSKDRHLLNQLRAFHYPLAAFDKVLTLHTVYDAFLQDDLTPASIPVGLFYILSLFLR